MYKIDRDKNEIQPLTVKTFAELQFKERQHLQEWIAKHPNCLGEDLLILQKEFSDFSDTNERLDLLALDKAGHLVIIENKLDDTGKDVVWQALKYASYCSKLTRENVRSIYQDYLSKSGQNAVAEDNIVEFLGCADFEDVTINSGFTQRIILVAANFRKEVTSTIIWLMNFNIRAQCFKVTPYAMQEQLFLNMEQIIPVKDAEDYIIGLASKAQDELVSNKEEQQIKKLRREFWKELIAASTQKHNLFSSISPNAIHYIAAGSGVGGVRYNFSISRNYGRAEIYIDRGDKTDNKKFFDKLHECKSQVEQLFGGELSWERLDERQASRIKSEMGCDTTDKENWPTLIEFLVDAMYKLEKASRALIQTTGQKLGSEPSDTEI